MLGAEKSGERSAPAQRVVIAFGGIAFRLVSFGQFGFWTDEAYVALTTRVTSPAEFWLATGPTPLAWAASLRLVAPWQPPEVGLRVVPLLFGVGTLALAWRFGVRAGASATAGVVALAAIAFDPVSVAYAKEFKQYGAEAFFALLAFVCLAETTRRPSAGATARLALALAIGVLFSNSQLLVAPPVLLALLGAAFARRDGAGIRWALVAIAAVGTWMGAWYFLVMVPHLRPRLTEVFANAFVPRHSVADAAAFVWTVTTERLGITLGPVGWSVGFAALVVAAFAESSFRPVTAALVLLFAETVGLSVAGRVPFSEPRAVLFLYTTMAAVLGAALGWTAAPARRRLPRILAAVTLMGLAVDFAARTDWRALVVPQRVEDVGPLVRTVEAARGPEDVVLVYWRSRYVWAYYQRAQPRLVPVFANAVGYVPAIDDPRVRLVENANAADVVGDAFADAAVVWFVGSRLGFDAAVLQSVLVQHGNVTQRETRENALLLRLERRSP